MGRICYTDDTAGRSVLSGCLDQRKKLLLLVWSYVLDDGKERRYVAVAHVHPHTSS